MSMMQQKDKLEKFKISQNPLDSLHAKYSSSTGATVVTVSFVLRIPLFSVNSHFLNTKIRMLVGDIYKLMPSLCIC